MASLCIQNILLYYTNKFIKHLAWITKFSPIGVHVNYIYHKQFSYNELIVTLEFMPKAVWDRQGNHAMFSTMVAKTF